LRDETGPDPTDNPAPGADARSADEPFETRPIDVDPPYAVSESPSLRVSIKTSRSRHSRASMYATAQTRRDPPFTLVS